MPAYDQIEYYNIQRNCTILNDMVVDRVLIFVGCCYFSTFKRSTVAKLSVLESGFLHFYYYFSNCCSVHAFIAIAAHYGTRKNFQQIFKRWYMLFNRRKNIQFLYSLLQCYVIFAYGHGRNKMWWSYMQL